MGNDVTERLLEITLEERHRKAAGFLQEYDDLAWFFNAYFATAGTLALAAAASERICTTFERSLSATMWQQAQHYQLDALIHILNRAPDSGLALLRSAAELARDFSIIAKDAAALAIWKGRVHGPELHDKYRERFKFERSRNGNAGWRLYKLCCKYGIHGHQTGFAFSSSEPSEDKQRMMFFEPGQAAVFFGLRAWLFGIPAISNLFISALTIPRADQATRKPFDAYQKLVEGLPIITAKITALSNASDGAGE